MEKEFVPYEQALELKEIMFDEECFGFYTEEYKKLAKVYCKYPIDLPTKPVIAPTFSQAFRFFREKYNIVHSIDWMTRSGGEYPSGYIVHFRGINENILPIYNIMLNEGNIIVLNNTELPGYEVFPTYEEAELSCLKKLIEMVKNK